MPNKSRLPFQFPRDPNLSAEALQTLDSMLTQVNTLLSQGGVPPGTGLQAFGANVINPTSNQIVSAGNRVSSIATSIIAVPSSTSIQFFWDGTNGSQAFKIYRDDGTITGPTINGSGFKVSGLTPSTTYFFYFYWDETLAIITPALVAGATVGTPSCAFTAANVLAGQQQILKGRIAVAPNLSSAGVATTAAGTGAGVTGGTGGGAGGGQFCPLKGAPVKLYGQQSWWEHTVESNEDFIELETESGRRGTFSLAHRLYSHLGLMAVSLLRFGDTVLTEDGEEKIIDAKYVYRKGAQVDHYEAQRGHVFSAWGFISHNVKGV